MAFSALTVAVSVVDVGLFGGFAHAPVALHTFGALEVIVKNDGRFDLLLADIRMPVMDGIALALATARDYPELTILLMTGYADQRERAHGLDALIHDVISKPFTLSQIRDAVNGALRAENRRQTTYDR